MSDPSIYRLTLAVLAVLTAAGAVWLALGPLSSPGLEVRVPAQAEATAQPPGAPAADDTPAPGLMDLNTATADELQTLPSIGKVLAERIVAYRELHGPFQRVDQIMAVERIGPAVYQAVRHLVTVGE